AAIHAVGQRVQRRVVDAGTREVRVVDRVLAAVGVIRRHVGRVRGDRDRRAEHHLLPARRRFVGERHARQQRAGVGPEAADVRARIGRAFVEAQTGDRAVHIGPEFHADLDRIDVGRFNATRRRRRAPNGGGGGGGIVDGDRDRRGGRRVAGGIASHRRHGVTAVGLGGRIPRDAVGTRRVFGAEIGAVHLELHADHADVIRRRRRDRDRRSRHRGATGRGGHRDGRRGRVGVIHRDGHRGGGRRVAGGIARDRRQGVTTVGGRRRIPRLGVGPAARMGAGAGAVRLEPYSG